MDQIRIHRISIKILDVLNIIESTRETSYIMCGYFNLIMDKTLDCKTIKKNNPKAR